MAFPPESVLFVLIVIASFVVFLRFFSFKPSTNIVETIRAKGIIHYTHHDKCDKILTVRFIKSSTAIFKKNAYFFLNVTLPLRSIRCNNLKSRDTIIFITKLTDEQVKRFKYRPFDKALIHKGDFDFIPENEIDIQALSVN